MIMTGWWVYCPDHLEAHFKLTDLLASKTLNEMKPIIRDARLIWMDLEIGRALIETTSEKVRLMEKIIQWYYKEV